MPMFKTETIDHRKARRKKAYAAKVTTKCTFHILQLFGRKVDCEIIAQSDLSGIEANLLRTNGCQK
jgi:hypothetical protein